MKITKSLLLFSLVLGVSSCFETPEFDDVPKISLKDLYFGVARSSSDQDSVVLSLNFQDGDGDLGLETTINRNPSHFSEPFHDAFYFLENAGNLIPVSTYAGVGITQENTVRVFNPVLDLRADQTGILATSRTPGKTGYEEVPQYGDTCGVYTDGEIYVVGDDIRVIDGSFVVEEDIVLEDPPGLRVYRIKDIFYTEANPDSKNIVVTWLERKTVGSSYVYTEFDWTEGSGECLFSFDSRFQVVSENKSPAEGILRYSMKSFGFTPLIGNKTMKLRVYIKDRALHQSNIIETEDFTLNDIKK